MRLLEKYRPETKQAKKERLLKRAEQRAKGKGDAPTKAPPRVRFVRFRIIWRAVIGSAMPEYVNKVIHLLLCVSMQKMLVGIVVLVLSFNMANMSMLKSFNARTDILLYVMTA